MKKKASTVKSHGQIIEETVKKLRSLGLNVEINEIPKDGEEYAKLAKEEPLEELAEKCFTKEDVVMVQKIINNMKKNIEYLMKDEFGSIGEYGTEEENRMLFTINVVNTIISAMEATAPAQRKDAAGLYMELIWFLTGLFILKSNTFNNKGEAIREFIQLNM